MTGQEGGKYSSVTTVLHPEEDVINDSEHHTRPWNAFVLKELRRHEKIQKHTESLPGSVNFYSLLKCYKCHKSNTNYICNQ
jgi:hypothetical protein